MKKLLFLPVLLLSISIASFAQTTKSAKAKETTKTEDIVKGADMAGIMDSMAPMMTNMAKSLMDAQLDYYKQPGKLEEVAKLHKQYFDALVKEGFTNDQALKIITSDSILPKGNGVK